MPAGTVKIFKKCSPNGRVYLYLGNREYVQVSCDWRSSGHVTTILVQCDGVCQPVTGVVNIQVILVSDWSNDSNTGL